MEKTIDNFVKTKPYSWWVNLIWLDLNNLKPSQQFCYIKFRAQQEVCDLLGCLLFDDKSGIPRWISCIIFCFSLFTFFRGRRGWDTKARVRERGSQCNKRIYTFPKMSNSSIVNLVRKFSPSETPVCPKAAKWFIIVCNMGIHCHFTLL